MVGVRKCISSRRWTHICGDSLIYPPKGAFSCRDIHPVPSVICDKRGCIYLTGRSVSDGPSIVAGNASGAKCPGCANGEKWLPISLIFSPARKQSDRALIGASNALATWILPPVTCLVSQKENTCYCCLLPPILWTLKTRLDSLCSFFFTSILPPYIKEENILT